MFEAFSFLKCKIMIMFPTLLIHLPKSPLLFMILSLYF